MQNGTAADPGVIGDDVVRKGEPFVARFVPYACAKLHMAVLPDLRF